MYNTFFGFREKPFKLVPNPEYLFLSKSHEIALAHLTYALDQGEGFAVITGEVGTGKTTLCRKFLAGLGDQTESAYIFNPRLDSDQLLGAICHEFGIPTQETGTKVLLDLLNDYLIQKNADHHKVVLLIDEAQGLSTENLELVRMLSNLETTRSKLLHIVLVGQPELEDKLESHELRQLAQRISLSYRLAPLSAKDTCAYIQHRLWISAQRQTGLFTPDACRLAFHFSKGIPRLINIVCDRALLTAYSHNRPKVTKRVMHAAIAEIVHRGKISAPYKRWLLYLGAGVCLLAIVFVAGVILTKTNFRFKFNYMGYVPGGSEAEQPKTPTGTTFKIQDTGNPDARISTPPAETRLPSASRSPAGNYDAPVKPAYPGAQTPDGDSGAEPPIFHPVPNPDAGTQVQPGRTRIDELITRMEPNTSRKMAVTTLLSIWKQPRPNADLIPAGVEDADFFEIIARQYGLRSYAAQDNWPLVRRLNLPAIVALNNGDSSDPVYLALVGWHEQILSFEDGRGGAAIEADFETIRPILKGSAYIFWKNVLGYDMIISYGADSRAISGVKTILRQIGYDQISPSSDFDLSTRAAVQDFQARHKLSADGLVGPLTKIMLLQDAGTFNMPTLFGKNRPPS